MINKSLLTEIYPYRKKNAKKYDHGAVLVIGGSRIYSGSPAITAFSALRSGADIAEVVAVERAADIIAGFSPDLITHPLDGDYLSEKHLPKLLELTESMNAASRGNMTVVIGGGIGRREETKRLVRNYVSQSTVLKVIDADGIYAFEDQGRDLLDETCLLTPHLYEFFILTGQNLKDSTRQKKGESVKNNAAELGVSIILKGAADIISDGSQVVVNDFPVPQLTSGGCGDSLAGIAGAIAARRGDLFEAAVGAAYLNSKAGKLAANELGGSLVSQDLVERLPEAIRTITNPS